MTHREHIKESLTHRRPLVVGAAADSEALKARSFDCDIIELRLDSLGHSSDVLEFAKNSPLPLLITARGSAEGGQSDWSLEERAQAYRALIPHATLIDIELRDFDNLHQVVTLSQKEGVLVVGSFHDFLKTPAPDEIIAKFDTQPDLLKFALMANSKNDIKTHLHLLEFESPSPLSIMGMGPLGAAARPLMARAGSLLNYGFLGNTPTAPDQWPAHLLKAALDI